MGGGSKHTLTTPTYFQGSRSYRIDIRRESHTGFWPSYCQILTDLDKEKFAHTYCLYGIHLWAELDRDRRVGGSRPNPPIYALDCEDVLHNRANKGLSKLKRIMSQRQGQRSSSLHSAVGRMARRCHVRLVLRGRRDGEGKEGGGGSVSHLFSTHTHTHTTRVNICQLSSVVRYSTTSTSTIQRTVDRLT